MSDAWDNTDVRDATPEEETMISTVLAQRKQIEELEKACDEWAEVSQSNYQRAKVAEAKLAKAIEVIDNAATLVEDRHFLYMNLSGRDPKNCSSDLSLIAEEIRLASTKLKGQDYE